MPSDGELLRNTFGVAGTTEPTAKPDAADTGPPLEIKTLKSGKLRKTVGVQGKRIVWRQG
jgi:hypothetical protein